MEPALREVGVLQKISVSTQISNHDSCDWDLFKSKHDLSNDTTLTDCVENHNETKTITKEQQDPKWCLNGCSEMQCDAWINLLHQKASGYYPSGSHHPPQEFRLFTNHLLRIYGVAEIFIHLGRERQ
uniref:Uncharacterized protein n=1 Tax=Capitella teleta TaxID=283909 RepID=X2A915_CAPTE